MTITALRHALQNVLAAVNCREQNNDQKILKEIIRYIHISPKYCGILFKQLSRQNFNDYLNRYRIEKAKELMEEYPDIKIADLGLMLDSTVPTALSGCLGNIQG